MWTCKYCGYYKNSNQFFNCAQCHRERVETAQASTPKETAEPKKEGGGLKIDDSTRQGLIRIGVGLASFIVFFVYCLQAFISSMPNLWLIPVAIFVIAWVVIMFSGNPSTMVGVIAVFLAVSFFISWTGLNVEGMMATVLPIQEVKSIGCTLQAYTIGAIGTTQLYFQKNYVGTDPVDMAYKICMGISIEQETNWGCGADCLKIDFEGTPINNRPLLLRMVLSGSAAMLDDIRNVKIQVLESTGSEVETTDCNSNHPCTIPKGGSTELYAQIPMISCFTPSYNFSVHVSYDYSVSTPKFDVTIYRSRDEAEKKADTKTTTGYGPLKMVFAGLEKYYANELQFVGNIISTQIRLYYVPGGIGATQNVKLTGQGVTVYTVPDIGTPECDTALTTPFEIGSDFSYNFYPYSFCDFQAPAVDAPYKTIGFVGRADYTMYYEKSMVMACVGSEPRVTTTTAVPVTTTTALGTATTTTTVPTTTTTSAPTGCCDYYGGCLMATQSSCETAGGGWAGPSYQCCASGDICREACD